MFQEILKVAVIGTERATFSATDNGPGKLIAGLDREDREATLLGAAAVASLYDRAGIVPEKDPGPMPEKCSPDDRPRCSGWAGHHFALIMSEYPSANLPLEWVSAASAAGLRMTEELLPLLLDAGRMRKDLMILPLLGNRGRWLAAQNPDWSYVIDEDREDLWEIGNHQQRLAYLKSLRRREPAQARMLLMKTWSQEPYKERAEFLSTFIEGLSVDDEEFLESALDDNRKEVRRIAVDLLARLFGSSLIDRCLTRLEPLINFDSQDMEVMLPEVLDGGMQRDGVDRKSPYQHLGEKAWWLSQMLSLVPLIFWRQKWGKSADQIVDAASRCEWKEALFEGWTTAAIRLGDQEWIRALLEMELLAILSRRPQLLFQSLKDEDQDNYLVEVIRRISWGHLPESIGHYLLNLCSHIWNEELSREYIKSVKRGSGLYIMPEVAGMYLNPKVIVEAVPLLNVDWAFESYADRTLTVIKLRHDMLKEINGR